MSMNYEIQELSGILSATDEWDAGGLRAIAARCEDLAERSTAATLSTIAGRLEKIAADHPGFNLKADAERLRGVQTGTSGCLTYDQARDALRRGCRVQLCTIDQYCRPVAWQDVTEIHDFPPERYRILTTAR